jgi:hypothetical protein
MKYIKEYNRVKKIFNSAKKKRNILKKMQEYHYD